MNTYCQQIMQDSYIIFFEFFAIQYKSFCSYGNLNAIWKVHSDRYKGFRPGISSGMKSLCYAMRLIQSKGTNQWNRVNPLNFWHVFHSSTRIGAGKKGHAPRPFFVPHLKIQYCPAHVEVMRVSWNRESASVFSALSRPAAHHSV